MTGITHLMATMLLASPIQATVFGDSNSTPLPNRMQTPTVNRAQGGLDTIEAINEGWLPRVIGDSSPVTFVMLGTNDAAPGLPLSETWNNLDYIYRSLAYGRPESELIACTLLPSMDAEANARIEAINAVIPGLAAEHGFTVLDVNYEIQQQPNWQDWYSDDYHLWTEGAPGYWWLAGLYDDTMRGDEFGTTIATPEPSTRELLGLGLALVGAYLLAWCYFNRGGNGPRE